MAFLPDRRPHQLSLGPLEAEILEIVWDLETATAKAIHDRLLAEPDRELAYASVMTVLRRLTKKGWLCCDRSDRAFCWQATITREQARALQAYQRLQEFLAIGNPDTVAAFAGALDTASLDRIEAIADRLREVRRQRQEEE